MISRTDTRNKVIPEDASIERVAPPFFGPNPSDLADAMGLDKTGVKHWIAMYSKFNEMSADLEDLSGSTPEAGRDDVAVSETHTHTSTHHAYKE